MTLASPIGILGGVFDPVHFGHLRTALELQQMLNLAQVRFIPCKDPVHKSTVHASAADRVAMLKLAIADQANFVIDTRELTRDTPSYMLETLHSLRQELPNTPLCLILGFDAFLDLPTWHQWQEVTRLAHFIVVERGINKIPAHSALLPWLTTQQINDPQHLTKQPAGLVLFQPLQSALTISSTAIRTMIQTKQSPRYLLPETLLAYIYKQGLYQSA